jgi:hypothetical protein
MTVNRTPDPLGLLPDHIHIESDGKNPIDEMKAIEELFNRENIMARIHRLRRHEQLAPISDELFKLATDRYGNAVPLDGDWELRAKVAEAELTAIYFDAESLPARTLRAKQKDLAQRLRPARRAHQKAAVIKAMIKARREDMTRAIFLESAELGSVEGMRVHKVDDKYEFSFTEDGIEPKTVSAKTVERWWTEANPSSS